MAWLKSLLQKQTSPEKVPLLFHNTLGGEKQEFQPLTAGTVKMYNCGPTVYGPQHIGNLSMFVFVDILRRTLEYNGYAVRQVINFTDVGHLTGDNEGDADAGEDRMTKGLKREGMKPTLENMRALGERFASLFLTDIAKLNIETNGTQFPRASGYIPAQMAMVQTLEEKGYAYTGKKGVYFDTSRFPDYGKLGNINLEGLREGARVAASIDKRHKNDFLLWKFDKKMGWNSPWGKGFPGWHIECSAMSRSILGEQIDIHTGGIEHIPIHHNNEIAQSEAATGKPFSRYWLHRAHLQIEGSKIAKSQGNTILLSDIVSKGFPPLALRYLLLGAHYRTPASFSWDTLKASQLSLYRLYNFFDSFRENAKGTDPMHSGKATSYKKRFLERINDDLDTPGALATLWEMVRDDEIEPADKLEMLRDFDRVLGLSLENESASQNIAHDALPSEVQVLLDERQSARKAKDWARADQLRKDIQEKGYDVEDTSSGAKIGKAA